MLSQPCIMLLFNTFSVLLHPYMICLLASFLQTPAPLSTPESRSWVHCSSSLYLLVLYS
jgi:hypothetical protein